MQTISTTQLRTKSRQLIKALEEGKKVSLIHRSRLVGEIQPKSDSANIFNAKRFRQIVRGLGFPNLSETEISKRYREAMTGKHGKALLGR